MIENKTLPSKQWMEANLPENHEELADKYPEMNTMLMLQAVTAILMDKKIIQAEEINEVAKELWKIQREQAINGR